MYVYQIIKNSKPMTNLFSTMEDNFRKEIMKTVAKNYIRDNHYAIPNDMSIFINEHGAIFVFLDNKQKEKRLLLDFPTTRIIEMLSYLPESNEHTKNETNNHYMDSLSYLFMSEEMNFKIDEEDLKVLFIHTGHAYPNKTFKEFIEICKKAYIEYHARNCKNIEKYGVPKTFEQWINGQIIALTDCVLAKRRP